jgi:hypothetical protein
MLGILGEVGVVIGECDVDNRLYRNADKCPCLLLTEDASNSNSASSGKKSRNSSEIQKPAICTSRERHLYKPRTSNGSCSSIVLKEQHPER